MDQPLLQRQKFYLDKLSKIIFVLQNIYNTFVLSINKNEKKVKIK